MSSRMMRRKKNILIHGFDRDEQIRLVGMLSAGGSDCPFCIWIEAGEFAPDLLIERFHPGKKSEGIRYQLPVLGLVREDEALETHREFGYQEVLPWERLTPAWLHHAIQSVIERFTLENQRREIESRILVRERLSSVGLFASSIAHEIGTPLGVIRGKAEFQLLKHQDDPRYVRDLNVIIQQVDRIARYVRGVVNLGSGSGGRVESVHLCSMMADVLALMEPALNASNITVGLKGLETGPGKVKVEPEAFRQVLFELFSNSIHAIEVAIRKGWIREGRIDAFYRHHEGRIECSFYDNGAGMSADELEKVFHPFRSNKGFGGGWGLGLAISYRWIESWNGNLKLESEPGRGTRVTFSLPEATDELRPQIEQTVPCP